MGHFIGVVAVLLGGQADSDGHARLRLGSKNTFIILQLLTFFFFLVYIHFKLIKRDLNSLQVSLKRFQMIKRIHSHVGRKASKGFSLEHMKQSFDLRTDLFDLESCHLSAR